MTMPKVIYVMGVDGSGKTTVVNWLEQTLRRQGYEVDTLWLRFNHLLSKPLLGLCRLIGLTRYETSRGIRVGYHDFHRSGWISRLFVLLQYLDAWRVKRFKIDPRLGNPKRILILDRFVYDILIDVMIDTRIAGLDRSGIGQAFCRLLPEETRVIALARDREGLLRARPESAIDRNFEARLSYYRDLPASHGVAVIDNDGDLDALFRRVSAVLGLTP